MTQDQTRQLGIEFERRIQEIYPNFNVKEKLDTDTIYSFLSEYTIQYIDGLILANDKIENSSNAQIKVSDCLKTLIKHTILTPASMQDVDGDGDSVKFDKPVDYYRYIRSTSIMSNCYKDPYVGIAGTNNTYTSPNKIIKQEDASSIIGSYFNSGNIIRYPLVILESTLGEPYIKVIHDQYTRITQLDLVYYRQPYKFNIINFDDNNTKTGAVHSTCELPYSTFDDILEGSVQLYISKYKFLLLGGNNKNTKPQEEQTEQ